MPEELRSFEPAQRKTHLVQAYAQTLMNQVIRFPQRRFARALSLTKKPAQGNTVEPQYG